MWDEDGDEWVVVEAEADIDPEQYIPHLQSRRLLRRQSSLGASRSLSVPAHVRRHHVCVRVFAQICFVHLCVHAEELLTAGAIALSHGIDKDGEVHVHLGQQRGLPH